MSFKLTPYGKHHYENTLQELLQMVKDIPQIQSCNTCMEFDAGTCKRYGMKPPADFQQENDCKDYSWDGVPF